MKGDREKNAKRKKGRERKGDTYKGRERRGMPRERSEIKLPGDLIEHIGQCERLREPQ